MLLKFASRGMRIRTSAAQFVRAVESAVNLMGLVLREWTARG